MSKKKKMIDIDDLLEDQIQDEIVSRNSDMVFISAQTEAVKPNQNEMTRLERIQSARVNVDEPLFDGETNLDLGKVTIGNEEDTKQIQKSLLENQEVEDKITNASNKQRDNIVSGMAGDVPEEIVLADDDGNVTENESLKPKTLPPDVIKRREYTRVDSAAVQLILEDLMRT